MRRAPSVPSALAAIGGFGVAVAGLSVAATAGIILAMPDPPALRLTVTEAAAALKGGGGPLERRVGAEPKGQRAPFLEPLLAELLGRRPDEVRVAWQDAQPGRPMARPVATTMTFTRQGRDPGAFSMVLRQRPGGTLEMMSPARASAQLGRILRVLPQPAFVAAVRQADGRWLSVRPRRPFFDGWRVKVLAALALSLALLAPLAWLFARRLTQPFRALAAAVETGAEPPPPGGPRELREAAGAIGRLRERVAAEAAERMRMLTAVAHDLRTPLTGLRLRIEAVDEPLRTRMAADADRMRAMIDDVLAFARGADAGRRPVALRPLAAAVAGETGGAVTLTPGPYATVSAVEPALRRAIENLVRNAVDHAGGGRIELSADAGEVTVAVIDGGPGIAAAERARLVRPFERGEASRNRDTGGVGLGLSIVQAFADAHGGRLELGDAPSGGAAVRLVLPAG